MLTDTQMAVIKVRLENGEKVNLVATEYRPDNAESVKRQLDTKYGAGAMMDIYKAGVLAEKMSRIPNYVIDKTGFSQAAIDQAEKILRDRCDTLLSANLDLAIAVSNAAPAINDPLVYTVTLQNLGPQDATGVKLDVVIPAGLTYVSNVVQQGSYDSATGVWTVLSLGSKRLTKLALNVTVDADQSGNTIALPISINAVDQADNIDSVNNTATVDVVVA